MELENTRKGLRIIFCATILEIVGEIMYDLVFPIHNATVNSEPDWSFGITGLAFETIAFIFLILGLRRAGRAEQRFRYAILLVVFAFVVNIVGVIVSSMNHYTINVMDCMQVIFESMIVLLICSAVANLYSQKGNEKREKEGLLVGSIFVVLFGLADAVVHCIFEDVFPPSSLDFYIVMATLLTMIAFIVLIIYFFKVLKEI